MRNLAIIGLFLLLVPGNAPSQTASDTTSTHKNGGRSSYDPMAHGKTTGAPKGMVESVLAGVNPQDKDYGEVVADWRKEVFENTIEKIYFWSVTLLGLGLGASLVGNGWLIRERERHLSISADIVTQLFNAYVGSRAKALDVVGKYNALVERYNQMDAERAQLKEKMTGVGASKPTPELDYNQAKEEQRESHTPLPGEERISATVNPETGSEEFDIQELKATIAEYQSELIRKKAQLQAKDNLISNLRTRLTKAHDSFEGKRNQANAPE